MNIVCTQHLITFVKKDIDTVMFRTLHARQGYKHIQITPGVQ